MLSKRRRLGRLLVQARTLRMALAKNCQHGTPCGYSCISPGKVCKAGGGVDPKVDHFFDAAKYPEFSGWQAEMSDADATNFVAESQVKDTLYHVTLKDRAAAIRREGVDTTRSTETVIFATGHYMAKDAVYAEDRFGTVSLPQKALIKHAKTFEGVEDFQSWKDSLQISSLPERVQPRVSMFELIEQGYDGARILQDTPGVSSSETWLAFHPKQVVTLKP